MRRIILGVCAAIGVVTLVLVVALVGVIIREWPHTPDAPGGRVEPPPWGTLDAAIEESRSRGTVLPPFVADATHGPAADGKLYVLVMSSGGQYGAFGAGVLTDGPGAAIGPPSTSSRAYRSAAYWPRLPFWGRSTMSS